jgi:DNA-binding response OmpR family regulator
VAVRIDGNGGMMIDAKNLETRDDGGIRAAPPSGNRLLVIDDNEPLTHWIEIAARRLGYDVMVADNIARCPDLADHPPNLILLDLHHGAAARPSASDLPSLARWGAPIVLISGDDAGALAEAEAAYRARGWPMEGCLSKPFALADFRALLLRHRAEALR